ncbi:hypothetical protein EC968_010096 [Mortierella alpina]|nr:hypothetical protein EC968_010096 [Mortierella alpina]
MQTDEQETESGYEVGQEQLDAVDRMLEELDLEENFDRVERLEQQRQQQAFMNGHQASVDEGVMTNGHSPRIQRQNILESNEEMETEGYIQYQEESDSDHGEPFGYIPLDQGGEDGSEGEENSHDESATELEDGHVGEANRSDSDDANDEYVDGQGYDGYLRSRNRDGTVPVPVIPSSVQIDLDEQDSGAAEQIPEEDLKTIAQVMGSFSLPAPDWARSIPEERWLPKIVQQAEAAAANPAGVFLPPRGATSEDTEPL